MDKNTKTNLKTLSNATELASRVIERIAGNEIATTVDGELMTGKHVQRTVAAKLQSSLLNKKKG